VKPINLNIKKGTISTEFLFVFIFLILIFLIVWVKIYDFEYETKIYKEQVEVKKVLDSFSKQLDLASYSDGYSVEMPLFFDTSYIIEKNYSIYVEKNYIIASIGSNKYFSGFNNIYLFKKEGENSIEPPFNLNLGEYKIENKEGVVYIEEI
jgi:hypothetical protein